ncbi:MAG: alpha/beta fold hydrolase [Pirellulaceae bacterium]|jgi:pimeloyl-ACP methyl ester carboxylesterase
MKTRTVSLSSGGFRQIESGEVGVTALFLHGVTRSCREWAGVTPWFAGRTRFVALDQRGHGESARANGYRVVDYVGDVLEWLKADQQGPYLLIGHSMGAMVALGVAAACSRDQLLGIVLEDPPFHTMGDRLAGSQLASQFQGYEKVLRERKDQLTWRDLAAIPILDPATGQAIPFGKLRDSVSLRWSAELLRRVDPEVLATINQSQWLEGFDWQDLASQVMVPTLLMQADPSAGGMLSEEDARWMYREMKDCHWIRFAGVGHSIHWWDISGYLRSLIGFLESLRSD